MALFDLLNVIYFDIPSVGLNILDHAVVYCIIYNLITFYDIYESRKTRFRLFSASLGVVGQQMYQKQNSNNS